MRFQKNNTLEKYKNYISKDIGLLFFHIGIFLLFSAPSFGGLFILISIFIKKDLTKKIFYKDFFNYPLLIVSLLMLLSCLLFSLKLDVASAELNYKLFTNPYIGLINWIPFFFLFSRLESFLFNTELRKYAGFFLICSLIPVLLSGFSQEFLHVYGSMKALNGLIIWYQRPNTSGMTGLFNNQNYTGCVIGSLLPLAVYFFYSSRKKFLTLFPTFLILISSVIGIILTNSRNAWLSIPLVFCLLIFHKIKKINLFFFTTGCSIAFLFNLFPLENKYIENLQFINIIKDPRIQIYSEAISYIKERPFFGWGGNGFASIWNLDQSKNYFFAHSHNIFLEFSIQYGLISAVIISSLIIYIFYLSFKNLYLSSSEKKIKDIFFEKAWFTSSFIVICSNFFDLPYYDIRISTLFWILITGIKVIAKNEINYGL